MGYHMAGHLAKKSGLEVVVWNRTASRTNAWANEFGASATSSIEHTVAGADVVFACLGRDEDVQAVLLQEGGAIHFMQAGAVLVDHTTTSATLAKTLSNKFAAISVGFLDGPVSGGEEGAKNGKLSCMLGGPADVLAQVQRLLECYCHNTVLIGDAGAGQLAKMVNQICIAGVLQGLSEGIRFAEAENLNVDTILEAISGGAAQSWQMINRGNTMHAREFDFGFALKWMIKDLGYCLDQADTNGVDVKLADQVLQSYQKLQNAGHENKDTSALIMQLDQDA